MSRTTITEFLERYESRVPSFKHILETWPDALLFHYTTDYGPLDVWAVDIEHGDCDSLAFLNESEHGPKRLLLFKNIGPGVNIAPLKKRTLLFSTFAQQLLKSPPLWQRLVTLFKDHGYALL